MDKTALSATLDEHDEFAFDSAIDGQVLEVL
jgi:hypothetical protein